MFSAIAFVVYKVLYSSAAPIGIHYLVDVPLLSAVFGDYGSGSSGFPIGEEERIVGDVPL